jgi:hypothetical protein
MPAPAPTPSPTPSQPDFGVSWTQPSLKHISVAKARDVARLDVIIGPKA